MALSEEAEITEEGVQQTSVPNQKSTPQTVTHAEVNNDQTGRGNGEKNGPGNTGKGTTQKAGHDISTESHTQTRGASKESESLIQSCAPNSASAQTSRSSEGKKSQPQTQTDDSSPSSDSDNDHASAQKPTNSLTHQPAGNEHSVSSADAMPDHTNQRKTRRGQKAKKR